MGLGVGSVLGGGKYRLDLVIGKGGMGEVFAATQLASGHEVAIKIVNRSMVGEILLQRLHREAIAARRIQSELVPRLIDVDHSDEGELFLVMERLHGETLSDRLKRKRALSWQEVNELTQDLLRGLIDAHTAGVVHRDLKPSNVFLENARPGGRERAKILDFGVCKIDSADSEHLTTTGEALGTVAYMAPEQIRGANKVDERADIYSLGMIVFEMLTGRLAYDASGQVALIAAKLEHKAHSVKEHALVAVPAGLDAFLAKALSRKSVDRFASAQEMLKAFRALGSPSVAPRVQIPISSQKLPTSTDTVMTAGTFEPETRQSLMRWGLAAGLFLAVSSLGMIAAYKYVHRADASASEPASVSVSLASSAPPSLTASANSEPAPADSSATTSASANPGATPLAVTPPSTVPAADVEPVANPAPPSPPAAPTQVARPAPKRAPPPPPPKPAASTAKRTSPGGVEHDAKF